MSESQEPICFKASVTIPVPTKDRTTCQNDYRPITLTFIVMKFYERLTLSYVKSVTEPLLDPLQFAYRSHHSADDAVNFSLHHMFQQLVRPHPYVRALLLDFSSAFTTVVPDLLCTKLLHLQVPRYVCDWITDFFYLTSSSRFDFAVTCLPPPPQHWCFTRLCSVAIPAFLLYHWLHLTPSSHQAG